MLCKIADLLVDVPEAGGLSPRCKEYVYSTTEKADITIYTDAYRPHIWPSLSENDMCYMESGLQFYSELLRFDGLMLHASAVELDGKAYLFSGPCGIGKSTHTKLWQQTFGPASQVFNEDKPALRFLDGKWYAYGTPWCGKDGINQNKKVPLAGICFLKQAEENTICQMNTMEASMKIISQTRRKFWNEDKVDLMLQNVERLIQTIPVFELKNRPEPEAAKLSYETMCHEAKEREL